jgi:hypothetical protein
MKINIKERECDGMKSIQLAKDLVADSCEHRNEASVFIQAEDFLDKLSDYQRLRKDSASLRSLFVLVTGECNVQLPCWCELMN